MSSLYEQQQMAGRLLKERDYMVGEMAFLPNWDVVAVLNDDRAWDYTNAHWVRLQEAKRQFMTLDFYRFVMKIINLLKNNKL